MKKRNLTVEVTEDTYKQLEAFRLFCGAPSMNQFLKAILDDYLKEYKQSSNNMLNTTDTMVM